MDRGEKIEIVEQSMEIFISTREKTFRVIYQIFLFNIQGWKFCTRDSFVLGFEMVERCTRQLIAAITRSGERGQTGGETLRKANKLNTFARACLIAARYLLGKCTPRRAPALKLLGF